MKGDIHDIGKNIVRTLLENYGFEVRDLGKDVAPEAVLLSLIHISTAPAARLASILTASPRPRPTPCCASIWPRPRAT